MKRKFDHIISDLNNPPFLMLSLYKLDQTCLNVAKGKFGIWALDSYNKLQPYLLLFLAR